MIGLRLLVHFFQEVNAIKTTIMRHIAATVCLLVVFCVDVALSFGYITTLKATVSRYPVALNAEVNDEKWDGKRTPVTAMQRLEQAMDASWGRGKFRTEVWEGDVNPINEWWAAYSPSAEEIVAAKQGFNFRDAKGWFEVRIVISTFIQLFPVSQLRFGCCK